MTCHVKEGGTGACGLMAAGAGGPDSMGGVEVMSAVWVSVSVSVVVDATSVVVESTSTVLGDAWAVLMIGLGLRVSLCRRLMSGGGMREEVVVVVVTVVVFLVRLGGSVPGIRRNEVEVRVVDLVGVLAASDVTGVVSVSLTAVGVASDLAMANRMEVRPPEGGVVGLIWPWAASADSVADSSASDMMDSVSRSPVAGVTILGMTNGGEMRPADGRVVGLTWPWAASVDSVADSSASDVVDSVSRSTVVGVTILGMTNGGEVRIAAPARLGVAAVVAISVTADWGEVARADSVSLGAVAALGVMVVAAWGEDGASIGLP